MRKRLNGFSQSLAVIVIFFILGLNVVSGYKPEPATGIEAQEMVQTPEYYSNSWYIESVSGGGFSIGRTYDHTLFFYNFTVMSNSTGSVDVNFDGDFVYSPTISDMILAPGETFGGNFTFVGEHASTGGTLFMLFVISLISGGNATFLFEYVIWDNYVFKLGLTGYIIIGSFALVFVIFVIVFIRSSRKKSSPYL